MSLLPVGSGMGSDALAAAGGAFVGGHAAQSRQTLRRKSPQGTPSAFELIDFGDQGQHLWRDLDSVGSEHEPIVHPITPISQAAQPILSSLTT